MTSIRALIVDDEPLARRRLRQLLADERDVEIAGEAATGPAAVRQIRELAPSLVLLDLKIPGLDGFGVIDEVGRDRCPPVIFVTAYDRHAVRAFDLHAVDYILKPFEASRLHRAIGRVRRLLGDAQPAGPPLPASPPVKQLAVPLVGRSLVLQIDDIDWIASAGNYAELHVGRITHLVHETMAALAIRLETHGFLRLHRSFIVNTARVREIVTPPRGDWSLVLHDGTVLAIGRLYRDQVARRFPALG
jgi:two-component system, LytTR family, response regulator